MLAFLIFLLTFGVIGADIRHYRRHIRNAGRRTRIAFAVWTILTDSLPLVVATVSFVCRDNGTTLIRFHMWMFFAWMLTVPPRMLFYGFAGIGKRRAGLVAAGCLALLFVWGATKGRTTIRVTRTEIRSLRLPAAFGRLHIVQLSDMHIGSLVSAERETTRIVDSVLALHPDLIVFCGDLVNIRSSELDERTMRILGRLKAPLGVFSVIGNHDVGIYIKDTSTVAARTSLREVIAGQRAMGWQVLDDTTVYLRRGTDSISLSGISFDPQLRDLRHDRNLPAADLGKVYRGIPDSLFNITLVHLPQLWTQVTGAGYGDLTLSGHVHAMQMKLHLFGREFSPARLLYKRWSGRYDENGKTLYINDGTGYVGYPMRLGAYPEITLITLERCE